MKILSTGEKIKQLRTDIGLKQDDISNDEITRSLISMIENNKRNLTYRTAKIISNSLNKYYVNLGAEITPDLLLESEVEQAQRMIRERLDEMQQLLENPTAGTEVQIIESFQKLIDFAKEWKLDEIIAELQETRGRFYFKTYQYNDALKDFFDAQEYYLQKEKYNKVASVYSLIGSSHYQLNIPEQALLYYEKAYDTIVSRRPSNYDHMNILVQKNKILCYIKLQRYDMAFKAIHDFKEHYKSEDRRLYEVMLMEANTYKDIQNYHKSIKLYDKLLKKSNKLSSSLKLLIYNNYADLYQKNEEYERSLNYIQLAYEYIDEADPDDVTYLYLKEARAYLKLRKIQEANRLIEKGLILSEKVSKIDVIKDFSVLQAKIYITTEQYVLAEEKLNWLKNYLEGNGMKDKVGEIYLYFVELYCRKKDIEECLKYTIKAQLFQNNDRI